MINHMNIIYSGPGSWWIHPALDWSEYRLPSPSFEHKMHANGETNLLTWTNKLEFAVKLIFKSMGCRTKLERLAQPTNAVEALKGAIKWHQIIPKRRKIFFDSSSWCDFGLVLRFPVDVNHLETDLFVWAMVLAHSREILWASVVCAYFHASESIPKFCILLLPRSVRSLTDFRARNDKHKNSSATEFLLDQAHKREARFVI